MLSRLYIENIAVIEKAEIDFPAGFNVLTGETGAGKSIVIDAICAVMGERTSRDLIRTGASAAFVSAEFTNIGEAARRGLSDLGIEPEDGVLTLGRELRADGRGICRINSRPASASVLRDAGRLLINIHGQHENQALLDERRHIGYIDSLIEHPMIMKNYCGEYSHYSDVKTELESLERDAEARLRRIDLLKYRIGEIEAAELTVGETEELTQRRKLLQNFERVSVALGDADAYLSGTDDSVGCAAELEQAAEIVGDLRDCFGEIGPLSSRLSSLSVELRDAASELHEIFYGMEYDPSELEEIETRLEVLRRITKKYGGEAEALVFCRKAQKELESAEGTDSRRAELEDEAAKAQARAEAAAQALTEARKQAAGLFCERVNEQLEYLDLPGVRITAVFSEHPMDKTGADDALLLIATNVGEAPKSIAKIASGGELSRIMLAIKSVLADKDDIDTLVFDEIDSGISGRAAYKVGVKLRETSRCRQLLCVTHLAQIAAFGTTHFLIEKFAREGRTYTSLTPLTDDERVRELARINGGGHVTDAAMEAAKELIELAKKDL